MARLGELLSFLSSVGLEHGAYLSTEGSRLHSPVPHSDGGPDCLRPYRPLDADGIVLHGSGNWDPSPYLGPGMRLAYLEPRLLETFPGTGAPAPSFDQEDPAETMKLFRVWDARSLLKLRPGPLPDRRCTRVFGAFKAKDRFRQIGDRRGQNSYESYLEGVSQELPAGFMLTRLTVPRFTHQLYGSTTDRRDFYTQCAVSRERAHTNAVKPCFRLCDFVGLRAHKDYCDWVRSLPSSALGSSPSRSRAALLCPSRVVHGCFSSLFQGDASGVEYATAAHVCFLEDQNILPPRGAGRVVARQPLSLRGPWAGVVIDDLFAVSAEAVALASPTDAAGRGPPVLGPGKTAWEGKTGMEPIRLPGPFSWPQAWVSESERIVRQAQHAYDKAGILGSPEKDVLGQNVFTIAGAQIDSSPEAVASGCVTVGSPVQKRLALSLVSLKVASCRVVSQELAAMLAGGWVSSLLFRRCGMAVLDSLFSLGSKEQFGEKGSPLVDLPARARQELALLAVLAPLLATNVAAPFLQKVVASDASLQKGAYTETPVPEHLSANLWLAADSKGFYTRLDSPLRASLVAHGLEPLDSSVPEVPGPGRDHQPRCPKPIGQIFDCLVIGPGLLQLDSLLPETGLHCGPRIDASTSPAFDLSKLEVCEWLLYMLLEARLRCVVLTFPGRAFSPARRPRAERASAKGVPTLVALRCLCVFWGAWRAGAAALAITPAASLVRTLPFWTYLSSLEGVSQVLPDGPSYSGSCFLSCSLPPADSNLASLSSDSPRLASALAFGLREGVASLEPAPEEKRGLESLAVNDLLASYPWRTVSVWSWRERVHINLLETKALLKTLRDLSTLGEDLRSVHVVDSAVTMGAGIKGRSSTRTLSRALKQSAALQLAAGLYPCIAFGPTRLNTADDPTRASEVRPPCQHSVLACLAEEDLHLTSSFCRLTRPKANWLRLACLLVGFRSCTPLRVFLEALRSPPRRVAPRRSTNLGPARLTALDHGRAFDSTLGFPGEGPPGPSSATARGKGRP